MKVKLPKKAANPQAYTRKFQIDFFDTGRKVQYTDAREFDKFEDFRKFIQPWYDKWGVKCSEDGRHGEFGPIRFASNYSVTRRTKPRNGYKLPNILVGKQSIVWRKQTPASSPDAPVGDGTITPSTPPRPQVTKQQRQSGAVVVLKAICRELEIDDRAARIALRRSIRAGKLKHAPSARWEWPQASKELEVVRDILKKVKK